MTLVGGVRLFELEPDLLPDLAPDERAVAHAVVVPGLRLAPGPLRDLPIGSPPWGAVVIAGIAAREVSVAGVSAAELVGPGDVVLATAPLDEPLGCESRWTVLETLHLAVLGDQVQPLFRRWPALAGALLRRSDERATRLAVAQAIASANRIDTRVAALLWALAARWGRVVPDGVVMPLRLTHRTIARLVGARRPSVTTAVSRLAAGGQVTRRADGSWMLHGGPPTSLGGAVVDRIRPDPAPRRLGAAH